MTEQPENTQASPTLSIPPGIVKTVALFLVRLVVAYAVVAGTIQFLGPIIEVWIARGARNLLGLVSSPYYLMTIEFIEGGYAYTTWIGPLRGAFKTPNLLFTFGFPIGYAMALPGLFTLRYWLRLLVVVLLSYFVCAICVAIICDTRITSAFKQLGIVLQPEWRHALVRFAQYYMWMFTVRLYPLLTVVILAFVSGQLQRHSAQTPRRIQRVLQRTAIGVLCLLLAVCVGFDPVMDARIDSIAKESSARHLDGLEELNSDIGPGLVKLAEFLTKHGNDRAAINNYRLALEYLEGEQRLEALTQRNLVHERIKAEMLEESRYRRELRERHGATP